MSSPFSCKKASTSKCHGKIRDIIADFCTAINKILELSSLTYQRRFRTVQILVY